MTVTSPNPIAARVLLLCGPSGSGKTSFAVRSGLPVLCLDDFYKEGDDPTLPQVPGTRDIDWDSPASWDAATAVMAIETLCRTGRARVPVYDIASSSRVGEETLDIARAPLFIAEGVFAADIMAHCQALGVLADALCLRGRPSTTFRRRLLRDLREGRKSTAFLLRRGWRLMRAERSIVARQSALGAHPCGRDEAEGRMAAALADGAARADGDMNTASAQTAQTATGQRDGSRKAGPEGPPGPPVPALFPDCQPILPLLPVAFAPRGPGPSVLPVPRISRFPVVPPASRTAFPRGAVPVMCPAPQVRGPPFPSRACSPSVPRTFGPRFPPDLQATSSPKDSSWSRPKLRTSSSRSLRSDRQMLDFTVPTLMSRISAISGSVRPS